MSCEQSRRMLSDLCSILLIKGIQCICVTNITVNKCPKHNCIICSNTTSLYCSGVWTGNKSCQTPGIAEDVFWKLESPTLPLPLSWQDLSLPVSLENISQEGNRGRMKLTFLGIVCPEPQIPQNHMNALGRGNSLASPTSQHSLVSNSGQQFPIQCGHWDWCGERCHSNAKSFSLILVQWTLLCPRPH